MSAAPAGPRSHSARTVAALWSHGARIQGSSQRTTIKQSPSNVVTPPARFADRGFSPLDEELKLLPGSFTPSLVESIVRLGTWMPFLPTAKMLAHFTKVEISKATVCRDTEKAGQAYVEVQH